MGDPGSPSGQSTREPLLVAAGDALVGKLEDINYDTIDTADWWEDLEARVERWRSIASEVRDG